MHLLTRKMMTVEACIGELMSVGRGEGGRDETL